MIVSFYIKIMISAAHKSENDTALTTYRKSSLRILTVQILPKAAVLSKSFPGGITIRF